jgi:hypothetical protein
MVPYARIILAPRYSLRLELLTAADAVDAECLGCGSRWRIAPHRLHDLHPPHRRLVDIAGMMRCRTCGHGDGMVWHIVRASPSLR